MHSCSRQTPMVMRYTESFWTINGSSADILFAEAFDKMEIPRGRLERSDTLLVEKNIDALGKITLPVTFGDNQVGTRTEDIIFDVADIPYKCNAIMGRGTICKFLAAVHQAYLCMKIPGPKGPIYSGIWGSGDGKEDRIRNCSRPKRGACDKHRSRRTAISWWKATSAKRTPAQGTWRSRNNIPARGKNNWSSRCICCVQFKQ